MAMSEFRHITLHYTSLQLYNYTFLCACASKVLNAVLARVLSSTQGANNTMMSTSLMTLPCTQECVIVKFHHIMNMHDQFMGMNTIQQPFLSCLPAFYALAIPMSCYISNVFYYLFALAGCVFFLFHERLLIYTCGIDIALFVQQWSSAAVAIK